MFFLFYLECVLLYDIAVLLRGVLVLGRCAGYNFGKTVALFRSTMRSAQP